MPVRGGDCTQATDKHDCEERALNRPCSVVCSGASTARESRTPARWQTVCAFSHEWKSRPAGDTICGEGGEEATQRARSAYGDGAGSYSVPVKAVGEPCESRGTLGSLDRCAHSVEAAPAGRRQIDWTGEVRNDRLPERNFMRRPMSIVRGATEPSSAVEPRNRARRNFGKCLPPRTTDMSLGAAKNDQLVYARASTYDNRFPRRT